MELHLLGVLQAGAGSSALAVLFGVVLPLFDLVGHDSCVLAGAFIDLTFIPCSLALCLELVAAGAQLSNRLLRQELLECPLLNVLLLVLF